jgi:4-amino-4-deoxy-L-arabinose transferase-like glycosyltransferase
MKREHLQRESDLLGRVWSFALRSGRESLLVAVLLTIAGAAFSRGLGARAAFDEGVYLTSLDALHHGQQLATQIFTSQPPGFYLLLQLEGALLGRGEHSIRLAMIAMALIGVAASYWIGRLIAGRLAGAAAALLYVVIPPIAKEAARARADVPSAVLSLLAVGSALQARRSHPLLFGLLSGCFFAFAVSVKLDSAITAIPLIALLIPLRLRRAAYGFLAGAAAVAAVFLIVYGSSIREIWSQAVTFHTSIEGRTPVLVALGAPTTTSGNIRKLVDVLTNYRRLHDPLPWVLLLGALAHAVAWGPLGWKARVSRERLALWIWTIASLVFLILHKPLWAHHVVLASVSLAVAAGVSNAAVAATRRRRILVGIFLVAALAGTARLIEDEIRFTPPSESSAVTWAAKVLREQTPNGSYVASDVPIVTVLANRRTPGALVDTSTTRAAAGLLPPSLILDTIERWHVAAVVVGGIFRTDPSVLAHVRAGFPHRLTSHGITIYLRE